MADTTFVNSVTLTDAEWFNDLNDAFYTALGGVAGAGTITKVQFPATQVASANANALDDYEEGTWTPTVGGTSTYTIQRGQYTKIGNLVTFMGHFVINAIGTGSTSIISGLPFTAVNDNNRGGVTVSSFGSLAVNAIYLTGYVDFNTTTIQFQGSAAAATGLSTLAIFGNGADVYFHGHYYVS